MISLRKWILNILSSALATVFFTVFLTALLTGFVSVTVVILSAEVCFAQASGSQSSSKSTATTTTSKKEKRTTINFEDQLVEGQVQKPELFYLLQQRKFNYKRLIRLREDFLPEMRKTSEEISRKGSGN